MLPLVVFFRLNSIPLFRPFVDFQSFTSGLPVPDVSLLALAILCRWTFVHVDKKIRIYGKTANPLL